MSKQEIVQGKYFYIFMYFGVSAG